MGRNINYQFKNAIDMSFDNGGADKFSEKQQHTGRNMDTVYSFAERSNLLELSHQLGDYVKTNFNDVKQVANIQPHMVQDFLNVKATTCNQNTLEQYASRIHKLEAVINTAYKSNVNWYSDLVTPVSAISQDKTRDIATNREDFNAIMAKAEDSKSQAPIAIQLAGEFGLRVSETTKLQPRDVNFETMKLHIHESKGGRSRDLEILPHQVPFLEKICEGKEATERIVEIKEDSVNKWLSRTEEAIGIRAKYAEANSGIHSIRKMIAQEKFDQFRADGMSQKDALDKVSEYLGHGKDRMETMQQYVLNIH